MVFNLIKKLLPAKTINAKDFMECEDIAQNIHGQLLRIYQDSSFIYRVGNPHYDEVINTYKRLSVETKNTVNELIVSKLLTESIQALKEAKTLFQFTIIEDLFEAAINKHPGEITGSEGYLNKIN